jgi:hypothetical protein
MWEYLLVIANAAFMGFLMFRIARKNARIVTHEVEFADLLHDYNMERDFSKMLVVIHHEDSQRHVTARTAEHGRYLALLSDYEDLTQAYSYLADMHELLFTLAADYVERLEKRGPLPDWDETIPFELVENPMTNGEVLPDATVEALFTTITGGIKMDGSDA